jgi:hypothetical protein
MDDKRPHLAASMVSKVTPIDVEYRVIVHMQKLMYDSMLHMLLIEEISLAKYDCAGVWRKTARMGEVAGQARDVGRREVCAGELEMLQHELNRWACANRERTGNRRIDELYAL